MSSAVALSLVTRCRLLIAELFVMRRPPSRRPACWEGHGDIGVDPFPAELVAQEKLHKNGKAKASESLVDLAGKRDANLFTVVFYVGKELWRNIEPRGEFLLAPLLALAQGADHLPKAHVCQALLCERHRIEGRTPWAFSRRGA